MWRLERFCLIFACVALAASGQAADASEIARDAGEELAQGKYPQLYARFNTQMKTAVTEAVLPMLAQQLFGSAGSYEAVGGEVACQPVQGLQSCVVPLRFEKAVVSLRFTVTSAGQIGGLFVAGSQP